MIKISRQEKRKQNAIKKNMMIKEHKEIVEKVLKGLNKCYNFSKGNFDACYGCPYNKLNEDCFVKLIANAYYIIYNLTEQKEGEQDDRENQQ